MTEKLTVADELEAFAHAYHNMQLLDIDDDIIRSFVDNFAGQFEFSDDEDPEESGETYRVYMKNDPTFRWGEGENYEFATREAAITKIINTYKNIPTLRMSRNEFDFNYWGDTYIIRKVAN
jgi:hypothetical protein